MFSQATLMQIQSTLLPLASALIEDNIQEMLNQAMQIQREKTRQALQVIVEQWSLENEQYRLSMQNAIATQFTNLS